MPSTKHEKEPNFLSNAVEVQTSVTVQRDQESVWSILADVEKQPEWMHDALSIEVLDEGPIGVGTRMRVPTQILFFRTVDFMEVTEFEPHHRWTVIHRGAVTGQGTFLLQPAADGHSTLVEWHEKLAAPLGPLGRLGMTVMKPILRRQFQSNLERFRALCEGT